jgi:hypothetical protein
LFNHKIHQIRSQIKHRLLLTYIFRIFQSTVIVIIIIYIIIKKVWYYNSHSLFVFVTRSYIKKNVYFFFYFIFSVMFKAKLKQFFVRDRISFFFACIPNINTRLEYTHYNIANKHKWENACNYKNIDVVKIVLQLI